jgi:hypothetical protein
LLWLYPVLPQTKDDVLRYDSAATAAINLNYFGNLNNPNLIKQKKQKREIIEISIRLNFKSAIF